MNRVQALRDFLAECFDAGEMTVQEIDNELRTSRVIDRLGFVPNRIDMLGLLQSAYDGVDLETYEDSKEPPVRPAADDWGTRRARNDDDWIDGEEEETLTPDLLVDEEELGYCCAVCGSEFDSCDCDEGPTCGACGKLDLQCDCY